MNVRLVFHLLLALLLPLEAAAQGYAGLGREAEGYAQVEPGRALRFPADHGPHPDFRIEWWYLTANMEDEAGASMGLQWTLFRQAMRPEGADAGWGGRQLWMGHAALTDAGRHAFAESFARSGIGQAGVQAEPFRAHIDDWEMRSEGDGLARLRLRASGLDFSYDVELVAEGPLVLHGQAGVSVKSAAGQMSYYYSQPHYRLKGEVVLDGVPRRVQGTAWLDREWSSQPLAADQAGWDWVSLTFADGAKLMGFRLRGAEDYVSGTWITPAGKAEPIAPGALRFEALEETEVKGRQIPTTWQLTWPERALNVTLQALNPNAYMETLFPYWEGPILVSGSHTGRGYLEMTGY